MAVHSLGSFLREAFRRCQLLGNQVTVDDFPLLWELREAFRQGQLLSNRIAFDDFHYFQGVTLGSLPSGTAA